MYELVTATNVSIMAVKIVLRTTSCETATFGNTYIVNELGFVASS